MKDYNKLRKSFSFHFSSIIVRLVARKPKYLFLGDEFPKDKPYMFLVNHCGRKSPLKIDKHSKWDLRIWGTYEMTMGFKSVRKYLIKNYYHDKKHYPKWWAWIIGSIVSPFVAGYYKGMRIIPTFTDIRFVTTLNDTIDAANNNMGVVIFPEDSNEGYKKEIPHFYSGFAKALRHLNKKGIDMNVYVGYLIKKKNTFVVMDPIKYSELIEKYGKNDDDMAEALRIEMNNLAKTNLKEYKGKIKKLKELEIMK